MFAAICLRITGKASCSWTERHTTGAGKNSRTVHYSGHEDYVSTSTYLVPGSVVGKCILFYFDSESLIFYVN